MDRRGEGGVRNEIAFTSVHDGDDDDGVVDEEISSPEFLFFFFYDAVMLRKSTLNGISACFGGKPSLYEGWIFGF